MAGSKKKIALLSNITADLIAGKLRGKYEFYLPGGFDTWVQEVANPASGLYSSDSDGVIVLLDGTEARSWKNSDEGEERVALWERALSALTDRVTDIPIFVSTIDIRENRIKSLAERKQRYGLENGWYQFVQGMAEAKGNVYVFDLADMAAEIGRRQFYSNKMWYMSSMPYSREGLNAVSAGIDRVLGAAFRGRKKVVALDLDNTLWGGVAGEDGVDGIELSDHKEGQRYFDFQRQLLEMKGRGIVLAINSKNNLEDAEAVIQGHPAMLLRDDDFVGCKINWENKAVNLKKMEGELNITGGGFIFIDDNPAEREIVRGGCPDVLVPDFPADTTELIPFAEDIWFNHCMPLRVLSGDRDKTRLYQDEARRKQEMEGSLNLDDYISKLGMVVDIRRMHPGELGRVAQLCNKTNQFNVTTKRYTQAELGGMAANPANNIYVVYSSDKYGDSGLVGLVILMASGADIKIDTFLMSCRVMGRGLEDVVMNELAAEFAGRRKIIGEFIATAKNAPVETLYDRLGFELVSGRGGHKVYELDLSGYEKKTFSSYKEIRFEG